MNKKSPTASLAAQIQRNLHKKSKRKSTKSNKLKKKSILNKLSTKRSKLSSKSSITVFLHEYQMKSRLTWEYADVFQDINNWHESLKDDNAESQPSQPESGLTTEKNIEHSPVSYISNGISMENLCALMHHRSGYSRQNLSPEDPQGPSDEISTCPSNYDSGKQISGKSTEGSTIVQCRARSEFAPNDTRSSKDLSQQSILNNRQCIDSRAKSLPCTNCILVSTKHKCTHSKKYFKCTECPRTFSHRGYLDMHKRVNCGEKRFKCTECPRMFSKRHHLTAHQGIHSEDKPFKCTECPRMFTQRGNLDRHQRLHSGEKPFKCTECPHKFSQRSQLTVHQRTHSGEKPFKCTECPQMFSQRISLTKHLRIHSGEKPFKCEECPQMFSQKSSLTSHRRVHTGVKPYKCTECPQMFAQKGNLTAHQRTHSGEKPFKCRECPQMFSQRSTLTTHLRLHSGEKPFKCTECPQMFAQKGNLTVHQRIHSREKPLMGDAFNVLDVPSHFKVSENYTG